MQQHDRAVANCGSRASCGGCFRVRMAALVRQLELCGFTQNRGREVVIEVEGERRVVEKFSEKLITERPDAAHIANLDTQSIPPRGDAGFSIREST